MNDKFGNLKNLKYMFIVLSIMIFLGVFLYLGDSNSVIIDDVEEIHFSKESGFYDEPFMLSIDSKGNDIYYTLDGTVPDDNAIKYDGPISIIDLSASDNKYSNRTDLSTGFYTQLLEAYEQESPIRPNDSNVDKATVVRAVAKHLDGSYSDIKSATYFIGFNEKKGYDGLHYLSVITDPDNLFDYEKGIFVTGKVFDEYVEEKLTTAKKPEKWGWWDANYRRHGAEWQREVCSQFFSPEGKLLLSQKAGMRVHGQMSRGYPQKSFSIRACKEYDNNERLLYPLFYDDGFYSAVTFSQGGNDYIYKVKDSIIQDLASDLEIVTTKSIPYAVFIDGEYWGTYFLTQKYDDPKLYEQKYGTNECNFILLKDYYMEHGLEDDYALHGGMNKYCSQADMTSDENFERVKDYIDLDSFIDYYALMIYIARTGDWPLANNAQWSVRYATDYKYNDGKWRWVLFDLNGQGFTENLIDFDPLKNAMSDEIFANLMTSQKFRLMLKQRILEIGSQNFDPKRVNEWIDNYELTMTDAIEKSAIRFNYDYSKEDMEKELNSIKAFFENRYSFIVNYFEENNGDFLLPSNG